MGGWALKTVKAITSFSDGLRREYTWDFWLTLKTTLNPFREYNSFSLTFFLITCVVLPRGPNPFVVPVSQNLVQHSLLLLTVIDFLDARPGRTKTKNMSDDNHDTAIICWKHLLWVCTLFSLSNLSRFVVSWNDPRLFKFNHSCFTILGLLSIQNCWLHFHRDPDIGIRKGGRQNIGHPVSLASTKWNISGDIGYYFHITSSLSWV